MSDTGVRSFSNPDDVIEVGRVRSEIVNVGGLTISRDVHSPGWRWSVDVKPVVGTETCQTRHIGYCVRGRVRVVYEDGGRFDVAPGMIYHILPGHDAWVLGDEPFEGIEWMGARNWITPLGSIAERVLATVVFTDIVDSTGTASRLGPQAWRELITTYESRVEETLLWYRGREVKRTGDGVLAIFDGAARAVRCAVDLGRAATDLGIEVRASVHTGEIELVEEDIRGLTVHETARMLELAGPGEVMVSAATKSVAADLGLDMVDRGEQTLRGLDGPRRLYAVARST